MTPGEKGIDIFVSYAHEDRERVKKLVQFLEGQGWSVWWDANLTAGSIFDTAIEAKLKAARCVIVVWSCASVNSDFVFGEASLAYGRRVVVPVLIGIDLTKVALGFRRVECVALTASDGYAKLQLSVQAMLEQPPPTPDANPRRRVYWQLGGLLALAAIASLLFWHQPSYKDFFRTFRPGGNLTRSPASEDMIGVTLWALRPSTDAEPRHTRMFQERPANSATPPDKSETPAIEWWTPVRVGSDAQLREGSKVRLGIESSRDGFVYVIDREFHSDETTGPPQLIFPTERTRGQGNRIVGGCRLELPTLSAKLKYWELGRQQQNYFGELLTIIISPQPIPILGDQQVPSALPDSLVSQWERDWGAGVHRVFNGPGGALPTPAEAEARAGCSHLLTADDPPPTTIYALPAGDTKPILARFPVRVTSKP
jgi:hypothetical protein